MPGAMPVTTAPRRSPHQCRSRRAPCWSLRRHAHHGAHAGHRAGLTSTTATRRAHAHHGRHARTAGITRTNSKRRCHVAAPWNQSLWAFVSASGNSRAQLLSWKFQQCRHGQPAMPVSYFAFAGHWYAPASRFIGHSPQSCLREAPSTTGGRSSGIQSRRPNRNVGQRCQFAQHVQQWVIDGQQSHHSTLP